MAKIIELILSEERRGLGKENNDPIRLVKQLWTKDGCLVAEEDPVLPDKSWFDADRLEK